MNRWLRRIRGSLGIGLTWAAVGFGVGAVLELLSGAPVNGALFENAFQAAVMGFINGVAFSAVLRIAEGRRTFEEMSLWRFAGWGGGARCVTAHGWGLPRLLLRCSAQAVPLVLLRWREGQTLCLSPEKVSAR